MSSQKQEGGEGSQNYQASGDIIIFQGVSEERARQIAEIVSKEVVLREGRAVAEVVVTERAERFTDCVFEKINQRDTRLFDRFEDPRFLAALTDAQRRYAETGDEELGEVLARVVVGLAAQPVRSMHEIVLRQAIIVAPQLASSHLRALAVNMYVTRFQFNYPHDAQSLVRALDRQFQPYYGGLPTSPIDYSYMSSVGAGTHMEGLQDLGNKPYQLIHKRYINSMYPSFTVDDIEQAGVTDDPEIARFLISITTTPDLVVQTEQGPAVAVENKDKIRFRIVPDQASTILVGKEDGLTETQKKLRKLAKDRSATAEQFRDKVAEVNPALAEFFGQLESAKAFDFQMNPVGMILARHEIGDKAPEITTQIDAAFDEL